MYCSLLMCVASPLKTALIGFLTELRLDAPDLVQLVDPVRAPQWLAEKRRNLIDAFLNAWDRGASRRNIISGFRAAGMVPPNRDIPLSNAFTRTLSAIEQRDFHAPGDGLSDFECALVTREDRLAFLQTRPNPIFPHMLTKPEGEREQWYELISHPAQSGRILLLPHGSLALKQKAPTDIQAKTPKVYAQQLRKGEPIWGMITRYAGDSRILIIGKGKADLTSLSEELNRIRVPHEVIQGGTGTMEERP
jgi:hypothetical protein